MILNYLRVAVRSMFKNKLYVGLNILGLAIGFATFALTMLYVNHENGFENFHKQADRIFRVTHHYTSSTGFDAHWARVPVDFVNQLPEDVLGIEKLIRFQNHERKYLRVQDQKYKAKHFYITDSNVFEVFDFKLIEGNPQDALKDPNSVVLTRSLAKNYFGNSSALGKEVFVAGDYSSEEIPYRVTGIMEDVPSNTHLPVEMLFSFSGPEQRRGWAYVYILLQEGIQVEDVESKIPGFIENFANDGDNSQVQFELQALADIHLNSHLAREIVPNGEKESVNIFFIVGCCILFIVIFNYINLSNAISLGRAKEMGVRKILGAGKTQLIGYGLIESLLYNLIAGVIALTLVQLFFPLFETIVGISIGLNLKWLVLGMFSLSIVCGLLAGIFPALRISAFNSLHIIGQKRAISFSKEKGYFQFKRIMILVQFGISIILVASTLIIARQTQFLHKKKLGLNKTQTLSLSALPNQVKDNFETFRNQVKPISGVEGIAACMEVPSREIRDSGPVLIKGINEDVNQAPIMDMQIISPGFTELMEMEIIAGEDASSRIPFGPAPQFSEEYSPQDYFLERERKYLVNETAMKQLGWNSPEEAVGQQISWSIGGFRLDYGPITGVVKDFHQGSLKLKIDPTIMVFEPLWLSTFLIKLENQNMTQSIAKIRSIWDEMFPAYPMEYQFLDELYHGLYIQERTQLKLLSILSSLAIFLTFLGLFALIAYALETRRKEIAIRKIIGASFGDLLNLSLKEYLLVLIIAAGIGIPVSYFYAAQWLDNFAYRIDVPLLSFVFTLVIIFGILLLTISFQTFRSTSVNPADILRDE